MAADERRQGKVNGKGKFYHPLRLRHRGHRGKAGENLKGWILGLNTKKVLGLRFYLRQSAQSASKGFAFKVKGCLVADGRR
jgi:hypothetical protein